MHILQIGDSNTDFGRITNGLYQILKEKDGDYRQGFLTINGFHFELSRKLGDYSTVSVRMNYSGAWACYDLFHDEIHAKDSPFGISAVANSSDVFAEAEFTGSAADIYYECISGAGNRFCRCAING